MRHRLYWWIVIVVLLTGSRIVVAQADSGAQDPPAETSADAPAAHNNTFVIGNDDKLNINVWKDPELTKTVQVRPDGKISMPLIGELQAAGRTPLQLEQVITDKLKAYVTQPDVTVIVEQINSQKFNILGKVAKPGSYPLTTTTTVLDAIAEAGGFLDFAKEKGVYILRPNPGGGEVRLHFNYKDVIKGKNTQENVRLEPHDTVIVP
ncbi:MAG: polysaccharide biosynthesis/export family protein [Acidobacteriaceae bacterium]